jgi:putative DNA primase/helicase
VLLDPWNATFDGSGKKDRAVIEAELFKEGSGILNWMVEGFLKWQAGGLQPPAAVQAETSDYRNASDSIAAWMAEECFTAESAATGSTDLFVSYKEWCYRAGFEALTQTSFGRALEEMGFEKDRPTQGPNRNKVVRKGLGLVPSGSWAGA